MGKFRGQNDMPVVPRILARCSVSKATGRFSLYEPKSKTCKRLCMDGCRST